MFSGFDPLHHKGEKNPITLQDVVAYMPLIPALGRLRQEDPETEKKKKKNHPNDSSHGSSLSSF
jgi:hypothetical protein